MCPCIGEMIHVNHPKSQNESCLDVQLATKPNNTLTTFCFPPSYGAKCGPHDDHLEPYCSDPNNKPDFCGAAFCYIDPSTCKSSKNNTYSISFFWPNLFYSYTTCGFVDTWKDFVIIDQLKGDTVRVGVPAILFPDHYKLDTDGNPIIFNMDINAGVGVFKGIYVDLLNEVALQGNFTIKYESVSLGGIELHGNSWDGCAHDVKNGLVDLCIGNFWETSARRALSQFSTAVFNDVFYGRVPLPKEDLSFREDIAKLFRPFTINLWVTILVATVGVGLSYTVLNSDRQTSMKDLPSNIMGSIYTAYMELMNGAELSLDRPMYVKSVTVTWAFFVIIVLAAYTANLAAFLSEKKEIIKVHSVEHCIEINCNLCHRSSKTVRTALKKKYPRLRNVQEFVRKELPEVPIALSNGTCDMYVESKYSWDLTEELWGSDCETMWIGDFELSFKVAWPVSTSHSEPIAFWLGQVLEGGGYDDAFEKNAPQQRCFQPITPTVANSSTKQIGVKSMTGPLVILGIGIAFGAALKVMKLSKTLVLKAVFSPEQYSSEE